MQSSSTDSFQSFPIEGEAKINFAEWLVENQSKLTPPVSNKMLFNKGQLKIMIVGGPNERTDYHVNQTEEFFYQMKGDMILKIVDKNEHKDVHIKEGEMFVLPGNVPHSPQRFKDTIGMVIELERPQGSLDYLRWYCEKCDEIVYQDSFYCYDLGVQLVPVIEKYNSDESVRTCKACGHVNCKSNKKP
ncbi:hypothetical protein NAEGRDRAFT_65213 [Naegleria gruberi]|uniref:3-hydroxyanthranilate 3,4-dioxygenase n=1 Tax=Naegleria gruberi TaxID=5762 RepID=D2V8M7_NAEGR|nr:uncharacterized protein NAEGRDRAFT_65213 [Naegleria gruberi]EFC46715.1 hypothetical protein NAEGRDRAFT_65213 [Naegleria gruberi]|eukprot:XP_002679459.1 hypothetical protein NAEGRDRAFT_65213 [Naegleria gruberi strain NEG-M]